MDIKEILAEHRETAFPPFPFDDEFADLVADLVETDAYYFGLASSKINGEVKDFESHYFHDLKQRLEKLNPVEEDEEIYALTLAYVESLGRIVDFLNETPGKASRKGAENKTYFGTRS